MGNAQRATAFKPQAASQSYRIQLIRKIKVACRQLAIEEDVYKDMVLSVTGRDSLTRCTDGQLVQVIEHLKKKGFRQLPSKNNRGRAEHGVARKARVMWRSLHLLGYIENPSEKALEAWACAQLDCERFAWADQSKGSAVIEALKAMAAREGWVQFDAANKPLDTLGLNISLCRAIINKLQGIDAAPDDWPVHVAAQQLLGIGTAHDSSLTVEDCQQLAAALGDRLRATKGGRK